MLLKELMEMSDQSLSTMRMIFRSTLGRRGIHVEFPGHANGRATEPGRGDDVDPTRLMEALTRILRLYDNKDAQLMAVFEVVRRTGKGVQVVFKYAYDDTVVNIPCALEPLRSKMGKYKLVIKTIMVKPNFKPHSTHDIVIML